MPGTEISTRHKTEKWTGKCLHGTYSLIKELGVRDKITANYNKCSEGNMVLKKKTKSPLSNWVVKEVHLQ